MGERRLLEVGLELVRDLVSNYPGNAAHGEPYCSMLRSCSARF